jgi:hypothetical protein
MLTWARIRRTGSMGDMFLLVCVLGNLTRSSVSDHQPGLPYTTVKSVTGLTPPPPPLLPLLPKDYYMAGRKQRYGRSYNNSSDGSPP